MSKTNQKLSSLSIFFPAYNEEENIVLALRQAIAIAPKIADNYEIIVINDGSKDGTAERVSQAADRHPHIRLVNQRNRGYGGALKRGFKESKSEWIFFTDSDRQFDLKELYSFIRATAEHKVVIGYRKTRAEGMKRALLARALKIWNRILLGFPSSIKDIDCAFKLLHRDVLLQIEPLFSDGAMISTELLLKLHFAQVPIAQVGVAHYPRRFGQPTGSNWRVIFRAIQDTFLLQRKLILARLISRQRRIVMRWQIFTAVLAVALRGLVNRAG
jgi:glycosyltransferase involved in cell wall biosynthesis